MPSEWAAAVARTASRDAIATTRCFRPCCRAGMNCDVAMWAAPRMPQLSGVVIGVQCAECRMESAEPERDPLFCPSFFTLHSALCVLHSYFLSHRNPGIAHASVRRNHTRIRPQSHVG